MSRGGSTRRWRTLRPYILRRDRGLCHLCGKPGADSVDHLVPVAHGGTDEVTNLAAAHKACNSSRGARGLQQPRTTRAW